ncbi:hypothetical protein PSEEN2612 [Pseudomonas entomophila L48]|uniref:Uncharacterized protein n=1 Tax=Pseudomonas entomophila (strain L48) TaxID=384676 RepID=Q1IAB0_PSEE4|nr:hypothetical protein PSEEN2612 [Pseudomonas entomophila L48]
MKSRKTALRRLGGRSAIHGLMVAVADNHPREEFPERGASSDSRNQSINETISIVRSIHLVPPPKGLATGTIQKGK